MAARFAVLPHNASQPPAGFPARQRARRRAHKGLCAVCRRMAMVRPFPETSQQPIEDWPDYCKQCREEALA